MGGRRGGRAGRDGGFPSDPRSGAGDGGRLRARRRTPERQPPDGPPPERKCAIYPARLSFIPPVLTRRSLVIMSWGMTPSVA